MTYFGVNYRKPLNVSQVQRFLVEKLAHVEDQHTRLWRDCQDLKMVVEHQKNRITSLQNEVFKLGRK